MASHYERQQMADADARDLFERILRTQGWSEDRRGEVHITCPKCRKEPAKNQVHFSFSVNGGRCFVCGHRVSISKLAADFLGERRSDVRNVQQDGGGPRQRNIPRTWQRDPEAVLAQFTGALDRVTAWQRYKPVSLESIAKWELGVGVLPSSRCRHRRLIVPVRQQGKIVGFRGRLMQCDCEARRAGGQAPVCLPGCDCPKWLTAGGSTTCLFNRDALVPGVKVVIIVENNVDVILSEQGKAGMWDQAVVVAPSSGSASWLPDWTEAIQAIEPSAVCVVFDNDYPGGLPNAETRRRMLREWRERNPDATPPRVTNGERLLETLSRARLPVFPYQWEAGMPAKMDLGEYLVRYCRPMLTGAAR